MTICGNQWFPHVTVASVIKRGDAYLMVRERHRGNKVINQPAGHIEQGESLQQAVIRETLEETGWHFQPEYLSGIYQFIANNGETYMRFTFAGKLIGEAENYQLDPAIEEVLWLNHAQISNGSEQLRSHVVLQCIKDFENGNQLPMNCIQQLESPK